MNSHTYLDHAASTPVDPRVLEAMLPWFTNLPANPSGHHSLGRSAAEAVEQARGQIASMLGCKCEDLTFVSGATESCNLAIKGLVRPRLARGEATHIVSSAIEHAAVLDPLRRLEREGAVVDLMPPTRGGRIDPDELKRRLRDNTSLVSIMWINNELGTINDIAAIGELCRDRGVLFHCDATQAAGKIQFELSSLPIDAISLCAHKMHGPKGIGALVLQGRAAGRPVEPLIEGGGHERGLRSGTLNVPGIVGFGAAAALCESELSTEVKRIGALRSELTHGVLKDHPDATINGDQDHCIPHILSITIPQSSTESLIDLVPTIACAGGSACGSSQNKPSHVLTAIGLDAATIAGTIRLSFGRSTTHDDVTKAVAALAAID